MDRQQNPIDPSISAADPGRLFNAVGFGPALQQHRQEWRRHRVRLACLPFQELRGLGRAPAGTWSGNAPTAAFPWLTGREWVENPAEQPPVRPLAPAWRPMTTSSSQTGNPVAPDQNSRSPVIRQPAVSKPLPPTAGSMTTYVAGPPLQAVESFPPSSPATRSGRTETDSAVDPLHERRKIAFPMNDPRCPERARPIAADRAVNRPVTEHAGLGPKAPPSLPAAEFSGGKGDAAGEPTIMQRLAMLADIPAKAAVRAPAPDHRAVEPAISFPSLPHRQGPVPDEARGGATVPGLSAPLTPGSKDCDLPMAHVKTPPSVPDTPAIVQTVEKMVLRRLQRQETRHRAVSAGRARTEPPLAAAGRNAPADDREAARRLMGRMQRLRQAERFRSGLIR